MVKVKRQRREEHLRYLVEQYCRHYEGRSFSLSIAEINRKIEAIGKPAIGLLERFLDGEPVAERIAAVTCLSVLGRPALDILAQALDDDELGVRLAAVQGLERIGEPALKMLDRALDDPDVRVRNAAIAGLGRIGAPALGALQRALTDQEAQYNVIRWLGVIGEPALEVLSCVLYDEDRVMRHLAIEQLFSIGQPAIGLLVFALEDPSAKNREFVLRYLANDPQDHGSQGPCLIEPKKVVDTILQELVVRRSGRSPETFDPTTTSKALDKTIGQSPDLRSTVLRDLCALAFNRTDDVRTRAVLTARELGVTGFAQIVKDRVQENPTAAADILNRLKGSQRTGRSAEDQHHALAEYWASLLQLEQSAQELWQKLTPEARYSSKASRRVSVAVFVVGTLVVIWSFILMTLSREQWQQLAAAIGAVGVFWAICRQQFWRGPVEQIQEFSARQTRMQAAFIGYANRLAQLRLVFENAFAAGEIGLYELERYQQLLHEATEQAWRQLREQIDEDEW
jgi:hypothetical protein